MADPRRHGAGSVIGNNLIQEGVFSRGVCCPASRTRGSRQLHSGAPSISEFLSSSKPSAGGRRSFDNVTILNNVLDNTLNYGAFSAGPIVSAGAIHVVRRISTTLKVRGHAAREHQYHGNLITKLSAQRDRVENVKSRARSAEHHRA